MYNKLTFETLSIQKNILLQSEVYMLMAPVQFLTIK